MTNKIVELPQYQTKRWDELRKGDIIRIEVQNYRLTGGMEIITVVVDSLYHIDVAWIKLICYNFNDPFKKLFESHRYIGDYNNHGLVHYQYLGRIEN